MLFFKKADYVMVKYLISYGVIFVFLLSSGLNAAEISHDAKRHMFRGQAAMEDAKNVSDYQDAVKEFKKAVEYAPHWADAWFNLGVAQEKAKDYAGAIESFNKYLELNPTATDRDEVEGRIFKLEYRLEKEKRRETERQATKANKPDILSLLSSGNWCVIEKDTNRCFASANISVDGNQITIGWDHPPSDTGMMYSVTLSGVNLQGKATQFTGSDAYPGRFTGVVSADGESIHFEGVINFSFGNWSERREFTLRKQR